MWSFVGSSSSNYSPFSRGRASSSDDESEMSEQDREQDSDQDSERESESENEKWYTPIAAECAADAAAVASVAAADTTKMAVWKPKSLTTVFPIQVLCMDGSEVQVKSFSLASILSLKEQVEQQLGLPIEQQLLFIAADGDAACAGVEEPLSDEAAMWQCGVNADSVLQLVIQTVIKCMHVLHSHRDSVLALAVMHDGYTLASWAKDSQIHLWKLKGERGYKSVQHALSLTGHTDDVNALTLLADDHGLNQVLGI